MTHLLDIRKSENKWIRVPIQKGGQMLEERVSWTSALEGSDQGDAFQEVGWFEVLELTVQYGSHFPHMTI